MLPQAIRGATCLGEVEEVAADSCLAILEAGASTGDGVYWLRAPDGGATYEAFCDMTSDGGKTLPLPCVSTSLVAKTMPYIAVLRRLDARVLVGRSRRLF